MIIPPDLNIYLSYVFLFCYACKKATKNPAQNGLVLKKLKLVGSHKACAEFISAFDLFFGEVTYWNHLPVFQGFSFMYYFSASRPIRSSAFNSQSLFMEAPPFSGIPNVYSTQ
jgi:hypothetical protein